MKRQLLDILACPACRGSLELIPAAEEGGEIESGRLLCQACTREYPIVKYVPRFVPAENYAGSFGLQWNEFRRTQLDSHTGLSLSRERLLNSVGLPAAALAGKTVLDVGCGAGRFAEVALSCGANLVALDYSAAVDACWQNLGPHLGLDVVQGDIYRLPFKPGRFDLVYCLGVLQHTPDVHGSFQALPGQLKPGGRLVADVYARVFLTFLWPKYWLRPFTRRMPQDRLLALVRRMVKYLLPVSLAIGRIPRIGPKLRYAIPVMNHEPDWPLSPAQVREWAVLNTFDMLAPAYDYPQTAGTLRAWFERAGMKKIEVFRRGVIVGRGLKQT